MLVCVCVCFAYFMSPRVWCVCVCVYVCVVVGRVCMCVGGVVHRRRHHTFEKPYECPEPGCTYRCVDYKMLARESCVCALFTS